VKNVESFVQNVSDSFELDSLSDGGDSAIAAKQDPMMLSAEGMYLTNSFQIKMGGKRPDKDQQSNLHMPVFLVQPSPGMTPRMD